VQTGRNKWIFFESKVNGSNYTSSQRLKDAYFRHYRIQTRVVRFRVDAATGKVIGGLMNSVQFTEHFKLTVGQRLAKAGFHLGAANAYADVAKGRIWSRPDPAGDFDRAWLVVPRHMWFGWTGKFTMDVAVGRVGKRLPLLLGMSAYDELIATQSRMLSRVPDDQREPDENGTERRQRSRFA
jgi:hypothetical protein